MKRIFLIVLDSCGIGEEPDAAEFGGTDVFWEKLGYSEDERRRIKADVRANTMSAAVNAMFAQPEEAQR